MCHSGDEIRPPVSPSVATDTSTQSRRRTPKTPKQKQQVIRCFLDHQHHPDALLPLLESRILRDLLGLTAEELEQVNWHKVRRALGLPGISPRDAPQMDGVNLSRVMSYTAGSAIAELAAEGFAEEVSVLSSQELEQIRFEGPFDNMDLVMVTPEGLGFEGCDAVLRSHLLTVAEGLGYRRLPLCVLDYVGRWMRVHGMSPGHRCHIATEKALLLAGDGTDEYYVVLGRTDDRYWYAVDSYHIGRYDTIGLNDPIVFRG